MHIVFEKETCNIVQGSVVLMWRVWIGTMYKLLGRAYIDGCANTTYHEFEIISSCLFNSSMLWHQWIGYIDDKGLHSMHNKGMVKGLMDFYEEV